MNKFINRLIEFGLVASIVVIAIVVAEFPHQSPNYQVGECLEAGTALYKIAYIGKYGANMMSVDTSGEVNLNYTTFEFMNKAFTKIDCFAFDQALHQGKNNGR